MSIDFLKALACQPHQNIPTWELEFHLWGKFSTKAFYCGETFLQLSKKEKESALLSNAEIISEVSGKLGFSAVTVPGGYWELAPGVPAYFWLPDEYRFRQIEILKKTLPASIALVANSGGVMAMPDASSYISFSCKLFENPEEIDEIAIKTLKSGLDNVKRFTDLGIEVLLTASDIADNSGPYFAPDQMERFILPYLQKWAEAVRNAGAKSILHTDGNIHLYLDELANSGINAIQAIDPVAGMDMAETLKKVQNKICLCGNVDCGLLLSGTPGEVYQETKSLLQKVKNFPGFVLGVSNAVQQETEKENFLALTQALQDFRKS